MRAIELFAGAGGLGIGIAKAGFETRQVIEWDRWCCDTLRQNRAAGIAPVKDWPEPMQADVRQVDFSAWENELDLVSGGPPCQPFSLGGKHRAHDDQRDMWSQAVRAVRESKPRAFIFENVKGLTRQSFASYFSYINLQLHYPEVSPRPDEDWAEHLARLEQHHTSGSQSGLHYHVVSRVLNAANYGVPQKRERVVFVGFRSDIGAGWSFPDATHSADALIWDQVRSGQYWERHRVAKIWRTVDAAVTNKAGRMGVKPETKPWRTVRDALEGLPDPESAKASAFHDHRFQAGARSYPGHTGSPLDGPAKTLKAGVHGVPGGENMLLRPDGSVRYFTVRESARLQTFSDAYRLHGSWTEAMRQLGNAVPVEMAKVVAKSVASHLKKAA